MTEEIKGTIDNMIRMGYSSPKINSIILERNQNVEDSLKYLESQKEAIILVQIKKLFDSGFTSKEVKAQLAKEGIDINNYSKLINNTGEKTRPKGKYILLGIALIFTGLLLLLLCKAVHGGLDFSFDSRGDFRRWKELFFQPVNSLLAFALGISLLARKKNLDNKIAKIILLTFGFITLFSCLFFSEVFELLVSTSVFVLYLFSTKKETEAA